MATPYDYIIFEGKDYPVIDMLLYGDAEKERVAYVATSSLRKALAETYNNTEDPVVKENVIYTHNKIGYFIEDEEMETMTKEEIVKYVKSQLEG